MIAPHFWRNLRLLIGVGAAAIFSLLGMISWIQRLPTMAVLVRRRLRNAVTGAAVHSQAVEDPGVYWRQNNALPGNRGDGFRYSYLLVMIAITPVYLWFELSFGAHLLELMGSKVPSEDTVAVEHWGHMISGIAVSLMFLTGWFQQCEKWNRPWSVRVLVSIGICLLCIVLTWKIQEAVIGFYVQRGKAQIAMYIWTLLALTVVGFLLIRGWLRLSVSRRRRGVGTTIAGLIVLVVVGIVLVSKLEPILTFVTRTLGVSSQIVVDLGYERQQAATLSLVRRGLQQGVYTFRDNPLDQAALASGEGKAALAMFPIIAAGVSPALFAGDRKKILYELMYLDWDEMSGESTYAEYRKNEAEVERLFLGPYSDLSKARQAELATLGRKAADANWDARIRELVPFGSLPPGLAIDEFQKLPVFQSLIGNNLGCFDCKLRLGMDRPALTREVFDKTQTKNVIQVEETLRDPDHFQQGRDGESAARTYWVPIWALLFSMVGAFTLVFKLIFTVSEYVQRRSFRRANAADSILANTVIANSKSLIAGGLLFVALFVYFSDNRVTSTENYIRLHKQMWHDQPIVGAIAAHWTINAQALLYPFTRKIRPTWMTFDQDPLYWLPWHVGKQEDE